MKRSSSDQEMDEPSRTSKKICLENLNTDPTTPIDDLDDADDLYGDSPAIIKHGEQNALILVETDTTKSPEIPSSSVQNDNIQLPGLGSNRKTLVDPEGSFNDQENVSDGTNTNPFTPNNGLQAIAPPESILKQTLGEEDDTPPNGEEFENGQNSQRGKSGSNGTFETVAAKSMHFNYELETKEPTEHGWQGVEKQNDEAQETGESIQGKERSEGDQIAETNVDQYPEAPGIHLPKGSTTEVTTSELTLSAHKQGELEESESAREQIVKEPQLSTFGPATATCIAANEAPINLQQQPLNPSSDRESEKEGTNAELAQCGPVEDLKQVVHTTHETVQQPLNSLHITDQQTKGTEIGKSATHQSEESKDSEAVGQETTQTFKEVAEANKMDEQAEFELDSSPVESSSDSDSDSSSSSSEGSNYEMLDPEEEARRLMQEDAGSDDEGKGSKATSGPLRTMNEKPEDIVPKPQVEVTSAMSISELGKVEHIVENSIVIKAKVSGERQALESGSLLCLGDRSVIGVVAETLGQVQQPYYSVRFTNAAAIAEAGISKGTPVYYVDEYSSYVFTQNLKAFKGSDASNIHDEEVGDDELEFSDDEAEAEHKRRVKQERQARRGGRADRGDGFAKGPRGSHMRSGGRFNQTDARIPEPADNPPSIKHDDQDNGEDLYTPLTRPTDLHKAMGHREAPQEGLNHRLNGVAHGQEPQRGRPNRGRGRGDRGHRGRGGRGDRRGGGGFHQGSQTGGYHEQQQHHQNPVPPMPPPSVYDSSFPTSNGAYPPPSPYGWPNSYPSNQYNPSNNPIYQTPSFHQQQAYANHNSDAFQYPQTQNRQSYAPTNSFPTQQSSPPPHNQQYPPHQASSPTTSVPSNIPPGAHINPAFFSPARQQPPAPQPWQQQNTYGNPPQPGGSRSPQSEAAFLAAQDRLNLLRQLSRSGGPQA